MYGNNGDFCHDNSGNPLVEFFSKAGSLMQKRGSYYGDETTAVDLVRPAWTYNKTKAMQLSMWLRDCRGGAGNRSGFREVIAWIAKEDPAWINANIKLIPHVGRWDDLISLIGTPCEDAAIEYWTGAILEKDGLACKWVPREKRNKEVYHRIRKSVGMKVPEFRKYLSKNTEVVETAMCNDGWYKIDYNKIPSVAAGRYTKAFGRHDGARYTQYVDDLEKGVDEDGNEVKINASVLFPHDCIRTLSAEGINYSGWGYNTSSITDSKVANAQFAALPNYMEENNSRIMPICDFSGSMCTAVSGSIQAIDVSMSLGLYCSDRVGEDNPFYRKFIPFSSNAKLVDWKNDSFSIAAQKHNDGFVGSTNIKAALDKILESAKMFGATNDQIPNVLLIISDMQFDQGCSRGNQTTVEACLREWEEAGYSRPKIVYWDTAGYNGSPTTSSHESVGLVSGFSPSILKAVFSGEDFTPRAIMERAIEKYDIVVPA